MIKTDWKEMMVKDLKELGLTDCGEEIEISPDTKRKHAEFTRGVEEAIQKDLMGLIEKELKMSTEEIEIELTAEQKLELQEAVDKLLGSGIGDPNETRMGPCKLMQVYSLRRELIETYVNLLSLCVENGTIRRSDMLNRFKDFLKEELKIV